MERQRFQNRKKMGEDAAGKTKKILSYFFFFLEKKKKLRVRSYNFFFFVLFFSRPKMQWENLENDNYSNVWDV